MIQLIKNIKFKYKFLFCFFVVIFLNAVAGVFSYGLVTDISNLVYTTYDKALMSSTFSQAAKAEYYNFELSVYDGLLAKDEKSLKRAAIKARRSMETIKEDLLIVKERALDGKIIELVNEVEIELNDIEATKDFYFDSKSKKMSKSVEFINEWNAKTNSKKFARKLERVSDEASVIGYEFRLESEKRNNLSLESLILVISVCALLALLFAFLMSYLLVTPLMKLKEVCLNISQGDFTKRAPIDSKDEVGSLAKSFNSMLNVIEEKDRNLNSLLSALPFGLFYFDEAGKISTEKSQVTNTMFSEFDQHESVVDFFTAYGVNSESVQKVVDVIYKNLLPFNSAARLLPTRLEVKKNDNKKIIDFSFKKHARADDTVERVIVIAEDVTKKMEALAKNKMLSEKVTRVSKASEDMIGFKEFMSAGENLYKAIQSRQQKTTIDLVSLKRDLHSLKGLVEVYGFTDCSMQIHKLETLLSEKDIKDSEVKSIFFDKVGESLSLYESYIKELGEILALNKSDNLKEYSILKIEKIKRLIFQDNKKELVEAFYDLDKFPINRILSKYTAYANQIVSKLGDKKADVEFATDSAELTYEEAKKIDTSLMHIIRNSIDHGIESMSERVEKSKPESGKVKIRAIREHGFITVEVSDDGRGIDGELLSNKALEKGVWTADQKEKSSLEDKINLIFMPSFSSKEEVSEVSGRGVGMDAVKDSLESMGGSIQVDTKVGSGTQFFLKIPTEHQ